MAVPIFISYRRSDSAAEAASLAEVLRDKFGARSTFLDKQTLSAGEQWRPAIESAVVGSKLLLAIIGPEWLRVTADQYGQRRIDAKGDVVRREIASALRVRGKGVIPILVRDCAMPPASSLPSSIAGLPKLHAIHLADFEPASSGIAELLSAVKRFVPYSRTRKQTPKKIFRPLTTDELRIALSSDLTQWRCVANTMSPSANKPRRELQRDFRFSSFQDALRFISEMAPQCELLAHHPRLENQWRDVRVGLTTWRNDYDVSNLDLALARQIEGLYKRQYADAA